MNVGIVTRRRKKSEKKKLLIDRTDACESVGSVPGLNTNVIQIIVEPILSSVEEVIKSQNKVNEWIKVTPRETKVK